MKPSKRVPVMLTRTSARGGFTYPYTFTAMRELGQAVAYYLEINQMAHRRVATAAGMAAEAAFGTGEAFTTHGVLFTISALVR